MQHLRITVLGDSG